MTHKNPIPLATVAIKPKMKQPALITIVCLASEICIEVVAGRESAMSMCGLRLVVHTPKHSNLRLQNYSVYRIACRAKIRIAWDYFHPKMASGSTCQCRRCEYELFKTASFDNDTLLLDFFRTKGRARP